ncbi:MAG: hypothetical protein P1V51_19875 [Deltaproteobacteria bacterium]|nr:hypothetical protein [Deltaproteobacteria bacterium]
MKSKTKIRTRKQLREYADAEGVITSRRRSVRVKIWGDDTITRWDKGLDLSLTTPLTVKAAVEILGF